jgi:hypothetical protein
MKTTAKACKRCAVLLIGLALYALVSLLVWFAAFNIRRNNH